MTDKRPKPVSLFSGPEEDLEPTEPFVNNRCTPELLLAFIQSIGHMPTLAECKAEFGGILGPMFCAWELRDRGLFPRKKP